MPLPAILLACGAIPKDKRLSFKTTVRKTIDSNQDYLKRQQFLEAGMKLGRLTLLVGALLAGPCGAAFGQATNAGDISGIVTDTTGAAVPGATVTVMNVETGVTKEYTT